MLSAIIPTRDRPDLLRDCLSTLVAQDAASESFEVIVVDDGSTVDLGPAVATAAEQGLHVRLERQKPSGLNAGRNRGAALATGSVLAYLDDDTLVAPGWVSALVAAFEDPHCVGVGGRIVLQLEADEPRWLTAGLRIYLSELDLGSAPRPLAARETPWGANCAVTRSAFETVGGFAAGLDRSGASLVSNGDVEFFGRVRQSGGHLMYVPTAAVRHRVPAERLTPGWFRRRARAQGVSDALSAALAGDVRRGAAVAREVARATRALPILVKGVVSGRGAVGAEAWLSYCSGRVAATWSSGADRRRD